MQAAESATPATARAARAPCTCGARAIVRRPSDGAPLCRACFLLGFENGVLAAATLRCGGLLRRGALVAVGASGGKDSAVLAHVLALLNARHSLGWRLLLLSIDEGIAGYRDDSLACVARAAAAALPLRVLSYADLYGWSMDAVAAAVGARSNCTFCGVFRRQALDRGAAALRADVLVTGHTADDMAETVLMNLLRGDFARLGRCAADVTGGGGGGGGGGGAGPPRVKPFKHVYEKEVVLYAYHARVEYFSTECVYAPHAYRGHARELIKELEAVRPAAILGIVHSAEAWAARGGGDGGGGEATAAPPRAAAAIACTRCGYMTSTPGGLCQACNLLAGLNAGAPRVGLTTTTAAAAAAAAAAPAAELERAHISFALSTGGEAAAAAAAVS